MLNALSHAKIVEEMVSQRIRGQKLNALSHAEIVCVFCIPAWKERTNECYLAFYIARKNNPGKMASLILKLNFNGQIIPAPDNEFEHINRHVI